MGDLQSNLAALRESRLASKARLDRTSASLSDFVDMKVNTPPTPTGAPIPVGGAVVRRLASGSGTLAPSTGGLNSDFESRLSQLIKATGGKVKINSGYRTPERQAQLYAAAVQKYGENNARHHVAPPGHSKHNEGLAADLGFADKATKAQVHQIASQFGLYFPMSWEDWHIEPVGSRGN